MTIRRFGAVCVMVGALLGQACKTAPVPVTEAAVQEPVAAVDYSNEPVLIQVEGPGLAAQDGGLRESVNFLILAGKDFSADKWSVQILDSQAKAVRSVAQAGPVPSSWSWDGLSDDAVLPPDGYYTARLSVWFPGAAQPMTKETAAFLLDTSGPQGSIALSDGLFSPDGDGVNDVLTITVKADDALSGLDSWTLDIIDPYDASIMRFYSNQYPEGVISWDGMSRNGLAVDSAQDYAVLLSASDRFGNKSTQRATLSTDILVIKDGAVLRIRVNSIVFKAYTADFMSVDEAQQRENLATLDLLAQKLKRFPGYKITMEGHAVSVYWNNPAKAATENADVLIPLSLARAEAIKAALVQRGLPAASMSTLAIGASRPIVPFSDLQNRWKNRRVEFILTK